MKKFIAFMLVFCVFCTVAFSQVTPDEFKSKFTDIYGLVFAAVFYVMTELSKKIPFMSKLPGHLISVIIAAVFGLIAALSMGIPKFDVFAWIGIVTFLYNLVVGTKMAMTGTKTVMTKTK